MSSLGNDIKKQKSVLISMKYCAVVYSTFFNHMVKLLKQTGNVNCKKYYKIPKVRYVRRKMEEIVKQE